MQDNLTIYGERLPESNAARSKAEEVHQEVDVEEAAEVYQGMDRQTQTVC